jgi:antitoxin component YwqK of YwqJK toxin-antitoxin module
MAMGKRQVIQTKHSNGKVHEKYEIAVEAKGMKFRDGEYTKWWETGGKKMKCSYKKGKLDGVMTNWDYNGLKLDELLFKEGELVEVKWLRDQMRARQIAIVFGLKGIYKA